jgi:hypothetical protein
VIQHDPPKFAASVHKDLKQLIQSCLQEQERLRTFRIRRIHLASRRLGRYFDPELFVTLDSSLRKLITASMGLPALSGIERISVAEELGPPRPDTLYLACLHLMKGEVEEIQRIRCETNSLVIGWFWDNHHTYDINSVLARALDICVPAHYHGRGFLAHPNPRTSHPLPLCCAQWSISTLAKILTNQPLSDQRSTAISGRFTKYSETMNDWAVGTRRTNLIRTYGNGLINSHIKLQLEEEQDYAYFSRSGEDRFADWCQHRFSFCLPLRGDLSLRFFDAIVAGQLPFVDQQLAGPVLDDLAPSLIAGRDYLLVDVASPQALLAARQEAMETFRLEHRVAASDRVREGHLLEHRVALLAQACLEVLQQPGHAEQQVIEPDHQFYQHSFDACLAALEAMDDSAAIEQLELLLERSPTTLASQKDLAGLWIQVLAAIDRRVQNDDTNAPNCYLKAQLCRQGANAVDRLGELLTTDKLPFWLSNVNEQFSRWGALLWRERALSGEETDRRSRQHAIALLLRLSHLHTPCPEWVLMAARELLKSDLADDQALPQQPRERLAMLKRWEQQLVDHPELLCQLDADFEQARRRSASGLDVSVVIPFHGRINELEVALRALEAQTNQDFEVVVVADGCDVDESVLAPLRAREIPASLIVLNECKGAFHARVSGATATSGRFLWFLDHDDSVDASYLELMLDRANRTEAEVVECPFWIMPERRAAKWFQRFSGEEVRHDAAILDSYLKGESHNNLANKLIRRDLWNATMAGIDALGLPGDARLIYYEDALCTVMLYHLAHTYASTIGTDYHYRQRCDSSMNSCDPAVITASLQSFEIVLTGLQPLLRDHGEAASLAAFQRREVEWCLNDLTERVGSCLYTDDWERVGRILRLFD